MNSLKDGAAVDERVLKPLPRGEGKPRASFLRRCARASALGLLLGYLPMTGLLYNWQTSMIFPGADTQGAPCAAVRTPRQTELRHLTARSGEEVAALFGPALDAADHPAADRAHRPTIVYFYGNGTCMGAALERFQSLRRLGANVLAADYLGYGLSGGHACEAGCYATADAAYDYLLSRADVDRNRIVAAGTSLGGAVAIDLAARRKVAGLAVFSTFTSVADIARARFPFLPVDLLLRHRFDSLSKLSRITCPVFIAHGTDDALVPAAMSKRLATGCGGPVTVLDVPGAGHNDVFAVGGDRLLGALADFLKRAK